MLQDSDDFFAKGEQRLGKIFEVGVEAIGQDKSRKTMTLEAFRMNLGFDS